MCALLEQAATQSLQKRQCDRAVPLSPSGQMTSDTRTGFFCMFGEPLPIETDLEKDASPDFVTDTIAPISLTIRNWVLSPSTPCTPATIIWGMMLISIRL